MKTALMFTMAVVFTIFASTSFNQLEYMIFSVTGAVLGSDIALIRSNTISGVPISLEEAKLRAYFEDNNVAKSGLITSYGFLSQTLNE